MKTNQVRRAIETCRAFAQRCWRVNPLPWPDRLLGPAPCLKEVGIAAWAVFICLAIPLTITVWIHLRSGAVGDFVYFYGIGRLLNEHPATQLYDYALQLRIFDEIAHLREGAWGPSPYPPYVAEWFSLFAHASFPVAYLAWMAISLAMFLAGTGAAAKEAFPNDRMKRSLAICLSLFYSPFLMNTLVNGQLASIAVFSVSLAVYLERRGQRFWSGLALSALAYKPTLLVFLLPMLLLTRRFKALRGFIVGAGSLVLASTAIAGVDIWPAYSRLLISFEKISEGQGNAYLHHWQFIDLRSLSYGAPGGRSTPGLAILLCIAVAIVSWHAILLWKSANAEWPAQKLAWASCVTWTLLLNVYVPIYDSSLVTIAVILSLGALGESRCVEGIRWVVCLAVAISAVAWETEQIASRYGIQPLTVLLFVLGLLQLGLLRWAIGHTDAQRAIQSERPPELSPAR